MKKNCFFVSILVKALLLGLLPASLFSGPKQASKVQHSSSQIIIITPENRQTPSRIAFDLTAAASMAQPALSLYNIHGKQIFQKTLQASDIANKTSGERFFGDEILLPSGYYFYHIQEKKPDNSFFSASNTLFEDVSQAQLPGDSTQSAFAEFSDITGDNVPDIILGLNSISASNQHQASVFINDGNGHFTNETSIRLPVFQMYVNDVIPFDCDGDSDIDILFIGEIFNNSSNNSQRGKLILNNGQGFFSEAADSMLPTIPAPALNGEWGLVNDDPYPDLLITTLHLVGSTTIHILLNNGNGKFELAAGLLPQNEYHTHDAVLSDVNSDALNDIVTASLGDIVITGSGGVPIDTLHGRNAILIQNPDGTFSDETDLRIPDINRWSKLMKTADINQDGAPDLYSINIGFSLENALNVLYMNDGNGFFQDETDARLPQETVIWNNDVDFRNFGDNGFTDMFMINVVPGGPSFDYFYINNNGFFSDQSHQLPQLFDFNTSCAAADIDGDQDFDLFIANSTGSVGFSSPDILYENTLLSLGLYDDNNSALNQFQLAQNYPNPFNPNTMIRYQLPKQADVTLVIYDLLGQKVRKLAQGRQTAGSYEWEWNGKNDYGINVASGIYVYQLTAENFAQSKKLILLR